MAAVAWTRATRMPRVGQAPAKLALMASQLALCFVPVAS